MPSKPKAPIDHAADSAAVAAYIVQFDSVTQSALQQVRESMLRHLPDSSEAISYQIVGFRSGPKFLLYISGWKDHCSIHGQSVGLGKKVIEKYPDLFKLKGTTLHWQPSNPPSDEVIAWIVKERLALL